MVGNVNCNFFVVLTISIILGIIQGHPYESVKIPSPEIPVTNYNKPQPSASKTQESMDINVDEPRTKVRSAANVRRGGASDGKIVFPSNAHAYDTAPPPFVPSPVTRCKNTTFCENPPYYPEDLIKIALKSRQDLKFLATVDAVLEIGQRIDTDNDESLCAYEETIVFPKSAENKDKQWLYIVNDDSFTQGVRIETCMTENTACSVIEGFADGYKTLCKQKFIYRQLAAMSSNGSLGQDFFRFPASCCCHLKFTGSPLTRMGFVGGDKESRKMRKK